MKESTERKSEIISYLLLIVFLIIILAGATIIGLLLKINGMQKIIDTCK